MPKYTVVKNTPQPADGQGRVYHIVTAILRGADKTTENPIAIARRWVLSTEPAAKLKAGDELDVSVVPVIAP